MVHPIVLCTMAAMGMPLHPNLSMALTNGSQTVASNEVVRFTCNKGDPAAEACCTAMAHGMQKVRLGLIRACDQADVTAPPSHSPPVPSSHLPTQDPVTRYFSRPTERHGMGM
jgi:hypothetical protein